MGKGNHCGTGHGEPPAHALANQLRAKGRIVPGFLLHPHEEGHVAPHIALPALVAAVRQTKPSSDALVLVKEDWFGRIHPAFEPHHPEHHPPHVIAFRLHAELDDDCEAMINEYEAWRADSHHWAKGKGKGKHCGRGHGEPPAHALADHLRARGRIVPGFLLHPHEEGHVAPHNALPALVAAVRQIKPSSDALVLVKEDWFGRIYPAFEPHHPEYQPPHVIAFRLHAELDDDCEAMINEYEALRAASRALASEEVVATEPENTNRQDQHPKGYQKGSKGWGKDKGPNDVSPEALAAELQSQSRVVPGFLLPPHEEGHVPPHIALFQLVAEVRRQKPSSEALSLVVDGWFGRVHPAFEPHHPEHQPPHVIAFKLYNELEELCRGETDEST